MNTAQEPNVAFRDILDDAAPPTLLITVDGVLFGFNSAASDFFGTGLNTHRGQDILDWLSITPGASNAQFHTAISSRQETELLLDIRRRGTRTPHAALASHLPQSHDPPLIKLAWDRRVGNRGKFVPKGGNDTIASDSIVNERRLRRELEDTVEQLAATSHQLLKREQEIRASEERYSLAVGEAGIWDWNIDTNEVYYSPHFAELLGYSEEALSDVIGDSIKSILHPDDLEPYLENLHTHLGNPQTPYSSEHRFRARDGVYKWFQARGRSICNDRGKPVRMTGIITDIDRLKRTEAALRESENRLKEAQHIGQIGDFSRDLKNDRIEWSDEVFTIFGLEPTVGGTSFNDFTILIHPEDVDALMASVQRAIEEITPHHYEYRIIRPDGSLRWIAANAQPVLDEDGLPCRLVGTVQDITYQKSTEAALQQAKEDAEYANRTKSEFLAHMSHELRTPLNSILGFSDLMSRQLFGGLRQQYREYAEIIFTAGDHLLNLINDILDLSKIEAGNLELENEDVDVHALIAEVHALLANAAVSGGVDLRKPNIDPSALTLHADARRLKQILVNLINNAIKFSPAGEVGVLARNDDGCVVISVTDTGCGIATENIPIVLDPFTQIRDNAHLSQEGTGLGLNLSKRLTELHGGHLSIESELGQGTTVTVAFPADRTVGTPVNR